MTAALTDRQWEEIDSHILAGTIILAIMKIRECPNVGVKEALVILGSRYEKLRIERPDDFTCSHDEYWKGFYS